MLSSIRSLWLTCMFPDDSRWFSSLLTWDSISWLKRKAVLNHVSSTWKDSRRRNIQLSSLWTISRSIIYLGVLRIGSIGLAYPFSPLIDFFISIYTEYLNLFYKVWYFLLFSNDLSDLVSVENALYADNLVLWHTNLYL